MPILGLVVPAAGTTTTPAALTPPDPMRGSFMMLHLGVGAPVAALVAWLVLGAVVGATAASRPSQLPSRRLALGTAIAMVLAIGLAIGLGTVRVVAPTTVTNLMDARTLAEGQVQALPQGALFFSIVELPQAPGAALGPHAHVPGFAYSFTGVETITFDDGRAIRVGPYEAGFMGAQVAHTHLNADGRLPAAEFALLIVALAGAVSLISLRSARFGHLLPVALVSLIAAGAIGTWNPWANDWLFLSVRPVAARGAAMPIPTASRSYESPDLGALPPGPYQEKIELITVSPGDQLNMGSAGAAVLFVLDGHVDVQPAGGSSIGLGARGATTIQPGASVVVTAAGGSSAHLLRFVVAPTPPAQ